MEWRGWLLERLKEARWKQHPARGDFNVAALEPVGAVKETCHGQRAPGVPGRSLVAVDPLS